MSAISKSRPKYKYSAPKTGKPLVLRANAENRVVPDRERLAGLGQAGLLTAAATKMASQTSSAIGKEVKGIVSLLHSAFKYLESIGHFFFAGFDLIGAIAQCFGA